MCIYDITRKLPEGAQVSLEMTGETGQMLMRSGRSRFLLQALPASDFPDLTTGEFPHGFTLPAIELKRLIENTQFAISTEETRYYLNGIYFHAVEVDGKTVLRAAATDGHRLARRRDAAPRARRGCPASLRRARRSAKCRSCSRTCRRRSSSRFRREGALPFGDVTLTTKLIDGTFPDYRRVIPQHNDKRLIVDKELFQRAVDRVSTISSERGRAIKLSIADSRMMLSVNNPDSGSASEELEVDYDSTPIDIGFNARYLLDIAAAALRRHRAHKTLRPRLADHHPGPRRFGGDLRADAAEGVREEFPSDFCAPSRRPFDARGGGFNAVGADLSTGKVFLPIR